MLNIEKPKRPTNNVTRISNDDDIFLDDTTIYYLDYGLEDE